MENSTYTQIEFSRQQTYLVFSLFFIFGFSSIIIWQIKDFDFEILLMFNSVYENESLLKSFKLMSKYGMSVIVLLYAVYIFLTFRNANLQAERSFCFLIVTSFFLATIIGDSFKEIIDRARPVISYADQLAISHVSSSPAFPSGHASKSMALVLPFIFVITNRSRVSEVFKVIVLLVAVLVCFSRISLQAHYLSDVMGGIATAFFVLPFAVWLTNTFYKKMKVDEGKLELMARRFIFIFIAFAMVIILI